MSVLSSDLRRSLERAVLAGRAVAESAAVSAVARLGVGLRDAPTHLTLDEKALRVALRARARQLGDTLDRSSIPGDVEVACPSLVSEVAYEQWHRFLFARFLELNELLHHPEYGVALTLADCEELADSLGEPDGWSVAARFAAEVLPGIFRPSDPAVRVRLAREDLVALETVVTDMPVDVFLAEDSLGWVYQYWQAKAKDQVNASGRKIGGVDLSPVTQLFTENYMVRFLLENSLGAWWSSRYPESKLVDGFKFLRSASRSQPSGRPFDEWPDTVAALTVMDPCCGSGHFLVAAFGMLWRMRAEEEGLPAAEAQDSVLRENLFGLELDPRCTQIATFALALEAWKQGGYRELPVPNIACSGLPARVDAGDWTRLAGGNAAIEAAMLRLHALFVDAETLGSLIDPVRAAEDAGLESVEWQEVAPVLREALGRGPRAHGDEETVTGDAVLDLARAADYLSRKYTLVVTNPPYLQRGKQASRLRLEGDIAFPEGRSDLATMIAQRFMSTHSSVTCALVSPQGWLFLKSFAELRKRLLRERTWDVVAVLGLNAFAGIQSGFIDVTLGVWTTATAGSPERSTLVIDVEEEATASRKAVRLAEDSGHLIDMRQALRRKDIDVLAVISEATHGHTRSIELSEIARAWQGLVTGDTNRYSIRFWEVAARGDTWVPFVSAPAETSPSAGRSSLLRWEQGDGSLVHSSSAHNFNPNSVLGRLGVLIAQVGSLNASIYRGEFFNDAACPLVPFDDRDLPAIWAYCSSPQYAKDVRRRNKSMVVRPGYMTKVPFDLDHWRAVADDQFPNGLPEPASSDATQWPFNGLPSEADQALQVAVARLVGFRWSEVSDIVSRLEDADGIVCLPAIAGELGAAERVRALLATSFGESWTSAKLDELLVSAGGRPGDLAGWLSTIFFKDHCKVFGNRPFVWHVWDGLKDGFSALVNYHLLDRATLEKLTYRTLGWWIDRQRADAESGILGADARLGAAQALQAKLQLILEGEPPYDIYVRWKSLAEQPIGWEPDLDDGVRMNIRPFVQAGVLRSKPSINWNKDRGTNPDGSERYNDLHYSVDAKRKARGLE